MNERKIEDYTLYELAPEFMTRMYDVQRNMINIKDVKLSSTALFYWKNSYIRKDGSKKEIIFQRSLQQIDSWKNGVSQKEIKYLLAFEYVFSNISEVESQKIIRNKRNGHKIDIFINRLNFAIEYDGAYWHRDIKEQEGKINEMFDALNIRYLRIRDKKINEPTRLGYIKETDFVETLKKCIEYINSKENNIINEEKIDFDELESYVHKNMFNYLCVNDPNFGNELILNDIKINPNVAKDDFLYNEFVKLIYHPCNMMTGQVIDYVTDKDLILRFYSDEFVRHHDGHILNSSLNISKFPYNDILEKIMVTLFEKCELDWPKEDVCEYADYINNGNKCDFEKIEICLRLIKRIRKMFPNYYRMWRIGESERIFQEKLLMKK